MVPGFSLSTDSSLCVHCPDNWQVQMIGIVIAAVIGGIILVVLIMVLNLTVAIGTINGVVFYANVVSISFYDFALLKLVISWLNLGSGFDVCFIHGLDAYWKTWLQFLFPSYVFLLVAMVIVMSKLSMKFSQLIGKRNPVATLDTLILLSYTKLLHTVITTFSFTTLQYPDGTDKTVWLPDARLEYLSGKHIVLFIAAILVLLAGVLYTLLLFFWQWLLYYQDKSIFRWVINQKLCQFLESYHAPYTFKHHYWTGLLLVFRIALYLTSAVNVSGDLNVSLFAIIILTSCLLLLKGIYKVAIYRNCLPNICLLYTSPSPRDATLSRMPSSA